MKLLQDPRRIVTYFKRNEFENEQVREDVREGKDHVVAFIKTPFMLSGSFIKFSLMGSIEHQEFLESFKDNFPIYQVFILPIQTILHQ
ncbi:MAG: hypothetical protein ACXADY_09900 [Candidatus Hodarchaeales archaeon]|jgi:hypothetical protein